MILEFYLISSKPSLIVVTFFVSLSSRQRRLFLLININSAH